MWLADATDTAGPAAIVTAVSGVVVSLATVYFNSRRQNEERQDSESRLLAEVDILRGEVERLRRQLEQAEQARIDRDRLMEMMHAYGGRRLRKRLLMHDLGGKQ